MTFLEELKRFRVQGLGFRMTCIKEFRVRVFNQRFKEFRSHED